MPDRVFHWKHGWIPLDSYARAQQKEPRLDVPAFDSLSLSLQGKIRTKLESMTGMSEPELAAHVQNNLINLYQKGDKSEAEWYAREGADLTSRANEINRMHPSAGMTQEKMAGMTAVTSAHKRWQENKDFAQSIAGKLAADEPFQVDAKMISDYNSWSSKRRGDVVKPHPDLKPGTYRPSELPTDFAAAKTPGMPHALNTDYVVRAAQIYRGEQDLASTVAGPKQRSFVDNLLYPTDDRFVTVDTWQYRAAMSGIPLKMKVGDKVYSHTLEDWADRQVAVEDGRAAQFGYDPTQDRYSPNNLAATIKAEREGQAFFQAGPASKADNWRSSFGTYPWFVKQTQLAAEKVGAHSAELQAVTWAAEGGGL